MPEKRLPMRQIREILRLHFETQLSPRQIASICQVGKGSVQRYLVRLRAAGLSWPLPADLDDVALERRLFPPPPVTSSYDRPLPDWAAIHKELKSRKNVTLQLLWEEYKQAYPEGYAYSWYCECYRQWEHRLDVVLRHEHRAGEKMFVDHAGQTVPVTDPKTGEVRQAEVFVAVPDRLGLEHIRQYQAAMFTQWKLAPNTATQRLAALRFFYIQVLKHGWSAAETPYPKKVLHLPQVLSQEEVTRLIEAAEMPFHRSLLMTLYATGARRAEVAQLKISDIDSQRMVVHIRGGKGRKDRDVMLSPALLEALRVYWRGLRHKPTDWLYLSGYTHRVAISNRRLVALEQGNVTFRWRDSAHANKQRLLTLPVDEFLRRFLLHLLPRGFMRIRNFGFLANRRRASLLPLCFQLLAGSAILAARSAPLTPEQPRSSTSWNCPVCGGTMHVVERLSAAQLLLRSPPLVHGCAA